MTTTTLRIGDDVDVYFNLHKKVWSVRNRKTRRVVAHLDNLILHNVTFRVSAAGNARVRREGRKNVHAFARGTYMGTDYKRPPFGGTNVTYNPYKYTTFVDAADETPVHRARLAIFDGRSVRALDTVSLGAVA